MRVKGLAAHVGTVAKRDQGDEFLAPARAWPTHHQSIGDGRVRPHYFFDLFDEDLLASGVDDKRIAPNNRRVPSDASEPRSWISPPLSVNDGKCLAGGSLIGEIAKRDSTGPCDEADLWLVGL
jgi:hypothetical protein